MLPSGHIIDDSFERNKVPVALARDKIVICFCECVKQLDQVLVLQCKCRANQVNPNTMLPIALPPGWTMGPLRIGGMQSNPVLPHWPVRLLTGKQSVGNHDVASERGLTLCIAMLILY